MKKGGFIKRSLQYIGLPLFLCILLLLVLPLVLINQRTLELTNLETRAQLQATLFAEKISGKLNTLEVLLESFAQQTKLIDLSEKSGEELLERIIRKNQLIFSDIEGVCILNPQGEKQYATLYHDSEALGTMRMKVTEHHIEKELSFCSHPFIDHGEQYLALSRSVEDSSGMIERILVLVIRTDIFLDQLNLTSIPGIEQVLVSDAEDSIVAFWENDLRNETAFQTIAEIYPEYLSVKDEFYNSTLQGGIRSFSKEDKLYTSASLSDFPYTLTIKGDIQKAMGSYDKALFISFSFLLVLILIAVISITRLSFTIIKKEEEQATILEGLALTVQERTHKLEQLSEKDALTGLPNRRKINSLLTQEIYRSRETNSIFSLLIIDIDHFKQVNDTYGHQIGDSVILEIVSILCPIIEDRGTFARWGGDELMVLLPDQSLSEAVAIAQALCKRVKTEQFTHDIHISLSIGATQFDKDDTDTTLIRRADMALYKAKDSGRNQVISS